MLAIFVLPLLHQTNLQNIYAITALINSSTDLRVWPRGQVQLPPRSQFSCSPPSSSGCSRGASIIGSTWLSLPRRPLSFWSMPLPWFRWVQAIWPFWNPSNFPCTFPTFSNTPPCDSTTSSISGYTSVTQWRRSKPLQFSEVLGRTWTYLKTQHTSTSSCHRSSCQEEHAHPITCWGIRYSKQLPFKTPNFGNGGSPSVKDNGTLSLRSVGSLTTFLLPFTFILVLGLALRLFFESS